MNPEQSGTAPTGQSFRMLEDIARELAGDVVFPTCFDIAIELRRTLQDPNQSIDRIAAVVGVEPLVSAKLLHLANSVLYNPSGREIVSLDTAIVRLGIEAVRSTALAIAMNQLLRSRDMAVFSDLATGLWQHSIHTASAAYVVARRLTRVKPEEAQIAGLVHDLGAFYMLYRAKQYTELWQSRDAVRSLIGQWHESIGYTLLGALGLPNEITEAVRDHDQPRPAFGIPKTLAEVVYVANQLAGGISEWLHQDPETGQIGREQLDPACLALQDEIAERSAEMHTAFS